MPAIDISYIGDSVFQIKYKNIRSSNELESILQIEFAPQQYISSFEQASLQMATDQESL